MDLYRASGARVGEANVYAGLADLERADGNYPEADTLYHQALDTYTAINMPFNIALALQRLGHTAKAVENPTQAREYYQQALDIFTAIGSPTATEVQANLDNLPPPQAGTVGEALK